MIKQTQLMDQYLNDSIFIEMYPPFDDHDVLLAIHYLQEHIEHIQ